MLSILASGTLVRDPQQRQGAKGTYATASIRVPTADADAVLVSLIAFNEGAVIALMALHKGDALSVTGRAKLTSWEQAGEQKNGLSVVADQILSLYQVEKRRRDSAASSSERRAA